MKSPQQEEGARILTPNRQVSDYECGEYEMLAPAIVTETIARDSKTFPKQLHPGEKISIVQIELLEDRIRGKLSGGGWISIAHTSVENWVWAKKTGTVAEGSGPKPYLGVVNFEKKAYLAAVFPAAGESCNATIMESETADLNGMTGKHLFDIPKDQITKIDKAKLYASDADYSTMDVLLCCKN